MRVNDKNIILVGFGSAGKTTIGRYIAERLNKDFFDVDEQIIKKLNCHHDVYIQKNGWEAFRKIEEEVVDELQKKVGVIISTGGGTLLTEKNRISFSKTGVTFYMNVNFEELYRRTRLRLDRVVANEWTYEQMKEKFIKREKFYTKADVIVDANNSPFEVSENIMTSIFSNGFTKISFEFWFRSTYKALIESKKLTSFVRPGDRLFPHPKGVEIGKEAIVRILSKFGTTASLPLFDTVTVTVKVESVQVKVISELSKKNLEGSSHDALTSNAVLHHLGLIYNRAFSPNESVTLFSISYL